MKYTLLCCLLLCSFVNTNLQAQDNDWIFQATTDVGTQIFIQNENTIAKDAFGNYFVTGTVVDPTQFGQFTIQGHELIPDFHLAAAFLAKVNSAGEPLWVKTFAGTGFLQFQDGIADSDGNIYVVGGLNGAVDFEGDMLDGQEALLAKFDSQGVLQWKALSNSQSGSGTQGNGASIAIGPNEDIIISGYLNNEVHFDNIVVNGDESHFLASYDADGSVNWVKAYGYVYTDQIYITNSSEIAIDQFNNIYLSGNTRGENGDGPVTFDNITFETTLSSILAKFDDSGNIIWLNHYEDDQYTVTPNVTSNNIAIDTISNRLIVAGHFRDVITFGNTTLTDPGTFGTHLFICKYDYDGNALWAKQSHGPANRIEVMDMDANSQGDIVLAISIKTVNSPGSLFTLGEGVNAKSFNSYSNSNGQPTGLLAKYKSNGDLHWIKGMEANAGTLIRAVQAVGDNSALIAGRFSEELQFGSATLNSTPSPSTSNYILAFCNGDLSTNIIDPLFFSNNLKIFPNPANGQVKISLPTNESIQHLNISSIDGLLVKKIKHPGSSATIDLKSFLPGIYILQAHFNKTIHIGKLIVH